MTDVACRVHASSRCSCSYLRTPTRRGTPIVRPAAPQLQRRPVRLAPSPRVQGLSICAQCCKRLPLARNPRAAAEMTYSPRLWSTKSHALTSVLGYPVVSFVTGSFLAPMRFSSLELVTALSGACAGTDVRALASDCTSLHSDTPRACKIRNLAFFNLAGLRCRAAIEESLALTEENVEAVLDGV
jgi:hypothetical protein